MLDGIRQFAFRRRRLLAGAWLGALVLLGGGLFGYAAWVPDDIDTGITIAARTWFYRRTFSEVERARGELAAGSPDVARARLERYLAGHARVQPAQLHTHAVIEAATLHARLCVEQGRPARAAESLDRVVERLPLEYRLWWAKGRAHAADGDHPEAAKALREAFKLTLHHAGVIEDYLASLGEMNANADAAWVADEFERALVRAAPHLLLKVGIPREELARRALAAVEIAVEHGTYFRHLERFDGERGAGRRIVYPPEMFEPWPEAWDDELVVSLRMANVWDGFTVDAVEIVRRDGSVATPAPRVGYLHREGSGVAAYAEVFTGEPGRDVRQVTLICSSAAPTLSVAAQRVIEKARRNLASLARPEGG